MSTVVHLSDGSSIDLRHITRVGRLGGDPDWLRYVVVLTGGTIIELYENRVTSAFGPVPQIPRADLVAKWEACTAELPRDTVRQLALDAGFTIKDGLSDLKDYVYTFAASVRRAR